MRKIPLLLLAAAVGGCSTAPAPMAHNPRAEAELQRLIAGRAAGPAVSCIPEHRTDRMTVIDEGRVAFRTGGAVYVSELNGPCSNLGLGGYAMRTIRPGGTGLCRGEIIEVVDTSSGMTVGSCSFGDFVPYRGS